jgi:hypothetical protein
MTATALSATHARPKAHNAAGGSPQGRLAHASVVVSSQKAGALVQRCPYTPPRCPALAAWAGTWVSRCPAVAPSRVGAWSARVRRRPGLASPRVGSYRLSACAYPGPRRAPEPRRPLLQRDRAGGPGRWSTHLSPLCAPERRQAPRAGPRGRLHSSTAPPSSTVTHAYTGVWPCVRRGYQCDPRPAISRTRLAP